MILDIVGALAPDGGDHAHIRHTSCRSVECLMLKRWATSWARRGTSTGADASTDEQRLEVGGELVGTSLVFRWMTPCPRAASSPPMSACPFTRRQLPPSGRGSTVTVSPTLTGLPSVASRPVAMTERLFGASPSTVTSRGIAIRKGPTRSRMVTRYRLCSSTGSTPSHPGIQLARAEMSQRRAHTTAGGADSSMTRRSSVTRDDFRMCGPAAFTASPQAPVDVEGGARHEACCVRGQEEHRLGDVGTARPDGELAFRRRARA